MPAFPLLPPAGGKPSPPLPPQLLANIFEPLFEVTKDPNSHPQLHLFLRGVSELAAGFTVCCVLPTLQTLPDSLLLCRCRTAAFVLPPPYCTAVLQVSGFDLVDDESKPERRPNKHMPSPREWSTKHNPGRRLAGGEGGARRDSASAASCACGICGAGGM